MPRTRRPRGVPAVALGAALVAASLLTLFAWSFASPPSSSPDDDYHLPSIWCAQGPTATCAPVAGDAESRLVPLPVLAGSCYAPDAAASASCQTSFDDELVAEVPTSHGNWNGGYPPVFYMVMNLFLTPDYEVSVVLMRLVNSLVTVGMVGLVGLLVPARLRVVAVVPIVITSVPLGLSLFASTNPSSWAIVSAATLWLTLYASVEVTGRRRAMLLGLAVLSALLGSGARSDACLFSVVAVGVAFILRFRELRHNRALFGVGLACLALSGYFFLGTGQASTVVNGVDTLDSLAVPWTDLALMNARELPVLLFGGFGYGPMGATGWLDTTFPAAVGALGVSVWAALVFDSLGHITRAKAIAVGAVATALVLYPLVVLGRTGVAVGGAFQPRYALPLLVILTGLCLLRPVTGHSWRLTRAQTGILLVALVISHTLALARQIRRYVTGLDVTGLNLDADREWWWSGVPLPATGVWLIGSLAFSAVCVLTLWAWYSADCDRLEEADATSVADRDDLAHAHDSTAQ